MVGGVGGSAQQGSKAIVHCADCCCLPLFPHLSSPSLLLPGVTFQTNHLALNAGLRLFLEEPVTNVSAHVLVHTRHVLCINPSCTANWASGLEQDTSLLGASVSVQISGNDSITCHWGR